jgi:hypothetical protein
MLKRYLILLIVPMFILASCIPALMPKRIIQTTVPFDKEHAQRLLKKGNNTVKANAFLRRAVGDIVTCGGYNVRLTPATKMAEELFTSMYNNINGGFLSTDDVKGIDIETSIDEDYKKMHIVKVCNSDGIATFENVADGEFYVTAYVVWQIPTGPFHSFEQGGMMTKRIRISGGETREVVLTRDIEK